MDDFGVWDDAGVLDPELPPQTASYISISISIYIYIFLILLPQINP